MKVRPRRSQLVLFMLVAGIAVYCAVAAPLMGVDPMLAVELGGIGMLTGWAALAARALFQGWMLARRLNALAECALIDGFECRVMRGGGRQAFVLGALRPRIFVGDRLLDALDDDELRAVLLHEDHHRRTRAPLRAAAIEAWLTLLGAWSRARSVMAERLVDLEEAADADAIRHGVSPADLASALVKSDRAPALAASYSTSSDRRLRALLAHAHGASVASARTPYEWLPALVVGAIAVSCHLAGMMSIVLH